MIQQVSNDFSIRLAHKNIAGLLQFRAQFFVVLNNAVVNQRNPRLSPPKRRKMRMRVTGRWRTMRCPAGVGNPGKSADLVFSNVLLKFCHAINTAGSAQTTGLKHSHPARVIPAILKAL